MSDPEVLCVGAAVDDTIVEVATMPVEDARMVAEGFHNGGGGPAATAAVTMARLGVTVGMCGTVGRDVAGDRILGGLEAEGVDVRFMRRDRGVDTAQSFVLVTSGTATRTIVTTPPPPLPTLPGRLPPWVHADHLGVAAALGLPRGDGRPLVSFDGGNPVPDLDLSRIDLYAPTMRALIRRYAHLGPVAALVAARAEGPIAVVATDGSQGAWVAAAPEHLVASSVPWHRSGHDSATAVAGARTAVRHVAAVPVDAVSTLGAGDVFHGALLAGIVHGRCLAEAVAAANVCAARSCMAMDGRSAIPDRDELEALLATDRPAVAPVQAQG